MKKSFNYQQFFEYGGEDDEISTLIKDNIKRFMKLSIVNLGEVDDDFIQHLIICLITSYNNFDESRGVKFNTYFTSNLNGEIKKYMFDNVYYNGTTTQYRLKNNNEDKYEVVEYSDDENCKCSDLDNILHINDVYSSLNDEEIELLKLRHSGKSLREIGEILNTPYRNIGYKLEKIKKKFDW